MPDGIGYGDGLEGLSGGSPVEGSIGEEGLRGVPGEPTGRQGMGGPGVDTPQEQQAVKLMTQAAQMFRQAAQIDSSLRPYVDEMLQKAFLNITKHYGLEEEGKLALKQSQMKVNKAKASKLSGQGPPPTQRRPMINY